MNNWRFHMLKEYFKIAIRNIGRNKLYSIINVVGLSMSIACCILIMLYIRYEFSYDRFHKNADRIYRFTFELNMKTGYKSHFAKCCNSWLKYIPTEFPEVEKMATLSPWRNITLMANDKKFLLQDAFYTDATFFNVFSVQLLKGDSNKVLTQPNTVAISESLARKYFGNADPLGQTLVNTGWYDGKQWTKLNYTITAVFKDIPVNSHFHTDLLISNKLQSDDNWQYVYLLLHKNANPADFLKKFPSFISKHEKEKDRVEGTIPHLQCIIDIHLNSNKDRELEENNNMAIIVIICLTGMVILIVALVNYLNLNTAGMYSRFKSLNTYKIHGCSNAGFFLLYTIESLIITIVSFNFAYVIILVAFPFIASVTGNILNSNILTLLPGALSWILLMFAGTVFVGCSPIILFMFNSSSTVKPTSKVRARKKLSMPTRRVLVIFQFSLTITLIISALVINLQGAYIQNRQVGAKFNNVLVLKLFNQDVLSKYTLLKSEFLKSPYIEAVTSSFEAPYGQTMDAMGFETQGIKAENKDKILWVYSADDNFFKFLHVPIFAGNDFSLLNENEKKEEYILNETAVKSLGWTPDEAIGKPFKLKFNWGDVFHGGHIVGVVKDFNLNTLHREIKPFVFFQKSIWFWYLQVKIDEKNKPAAIQHISKTWDKIAVDYPLDYEYNQDIFFQAYKKEIIQSRLINFFSLLAIIISCMGLFSISSIIILQRTKEIGIRKVNGASTFTIMLMLLKDFTLLVAISFVIACPVGYYAMSKWLQSFAYHINLNWWIFAGSGILALMIACCTVCWQSWQVARKNPVEALKYE
jgi:putative ABC transport system permease protein